MISMGATALRGVAAVEAAKTHCIRGHPFDERNTYRNPKGARVCRACRRLDQQRRRWERARERRAQ